MLEPNFWDDQQEAQKIINESNALKEMVNGYRELESQQEDLEVTYELAKEENDQELKEELEAELEGFTEKLNEYELQLLLNGRMMRTMRSWNCIPARVVRNPRIGVPCCSECIHAGARKKALKSKPSITSRATKPV